tara:strand:- start:199 stop:399 length:201 start_codon:yes stop_codon:yes gene_type:complete
MNHVWIISYTQQCIENYYGNYTIESIHASEEGAREHFVKLPSTQKNTWGQDFEVEDYKIRRHDLLD